MDLAKTEEIKNTKGVIDVIIIKNGQISSMYWSDVIDVFKELNKIGDFSQKKERAKKQSKIN